MRTNRKTRRMIAAIERGKISPALYPRGMEPRGAYAGVKSSDRAVADVSETMSPDLLPALGGLKIATRINEEAR